MSPIRYEKIEHNYRLIGDYVVKTPIVGCAADLPGKCRLDQDGTLTIYDGSEVDGPSGPTVDTDDSISPAWEHDELYLLMREGKLDRAMRPAVDRFFYERLQQAGMCKLRAWIWWRAVSWFAAGSAKPSRPVIRVAP